MNSYLDNIKEHKAQSSTNIANNKKSGESVAFQLANHRPEAFRHQQIVKIVNQSSQSNQLRSIQTKADNFIKMRHHPIQKKGFANPANPNRTRQWEGRGYINRDEGEERPPALAALVDQFKKEILTYIAHFINTNGGGIFGPHIAVIISGSNWNVSINSNFSPANNAQLQVSAAAAKTHIDQCWASLDNTYGNLFTTKAWFENDSVEAAYLAFRWAAAKTNVRAIINQGPAANRRVHGEMRVLNTMHGEAPDAYTPLLPSSVHPVVPPHGVPLHPNYRRVVRVGGSKTPCFDCAWEMDKVPTHNQAQANASTDAPGAHHLVHGAQIIGNGINGRVVTTMSPTFGPSFPTWQHIDQTRGRRNATINLHGTANFQNNQTQNYNALRAAYLIAGCAPAMI